MEPVPEAFDRALCVVAHPDDLEYGIASVVARWTGQGKAVAYVMVTSGEAGIDGLAPAECGPLREVEERRGAAVVGVDEVRFLGHADGLVEYGVDLRRDLAATIRWWRPQVVLTLSHELVWLGDSVNHSDHRAVGVAVLDATLDAGVASLQEHRAYIDGLGTAFDPDAFLRGDAEAAGAEVGVPAAVLFRRLSV